MHQSIQSIQPHQPIQPDPSPPETHALARRPACTMRLVDEGDPAALAERSTMDVHAPLWRIRGRVAAALFGEVPALPEAIGRFRITRELGAGGMGIVYAAHDPQLDRTVALKVLRGHGSDAAGNTRLVREAQAMARLRHRNVLTVYDAGDHQGQVYLAMEFVEGGTLAEWIAAGPRPWQEVLATLIPAGRGLEAAHQAGLVHRDFKPANVLLDREGHALVSDFGLARAGDLEAVAGGELEETAGDGESERLLQVVLTRTGALVGTPAYMSPEQFAGAPATPRSDQFSFCVVLFEALYGRRPFAGDTLGELVRAIERGEVITPPRGRAVPPALRDAVLRGLSVEPARRFPSMGVLLEALSGVRERRWGGTALRVGGAVVSGLLVSMGIVFSLSDGSGAAPAVADPAVAATQVVEPSGKDLRASERALVRTLVHCEDEGPCSVHAELVRRLVEHPEELDAHARVMPMIRGDEHRGYKLYGVRADSLFKALGFRNGDLLTALDEAPLRSPAQVIAAIERARAEGGAELTFERKGEVLRRRFTIDAGPVPPEAPPRPAPPPSPSAPVIAPAPPPLPVIAPE